MKLVVDLLDGYAEEGRELASDHCDRVGYKDALGGGRRLLDERRILLNCGCQLCSLEVEHCMLGVPEFGGENNIKAVLKKTTGRLNDGISDKKAINKHASKQAESSPNPLKVPSEVAKLCIPEFHLVGARMHLPMQRGSGVSTFPGTRDSRA
ncbi:hypothetical protein CRG98_040769 [Punica granatum]|uniref:Uncharacterized protein n=1 Tax=Punica granatum TaxID=22663 RepID=A0A2I0I4F3_PUNGR|nr:hypothetical protein CRG98_040769 [Punica granatum]